MLHIVILGRNYCTYVDYTVFLHAGILVHLTQVRVRGL